MKSSLDNRPARTLTVADRCDRCSARALVETALQQGGSLLWCGHHFALFEDALNASGATILVDERRRKPILGFFRTTSRTRVQEPPNSPPHERS
jgi:hypothetical protein